MDATGQTDIILSGQAKKEADEYEWNIQIEGQQPIQFLTSKFELSYAQFKLSSDHRYPITLTVNNKIPDARCSDQKKFEMFIDVFRKFLDNGEFDNNTVV